MAKMRRTVDNLTAALLVALMMVAATACEVQNMGSGAADLEQVGQQDRGRDPGTYKASTPEHAHAYQPPGAAADGWAYELRYSEVILSPDGGTLLAQVPVPGPDNGYDSPGLVLLAHDLSSGQSQLLPQYRNLRRINFSADGARAYLLTENGREVAVVDLPTRAEVGRHSLQSPFTVLDVTADGEHLLLSNLPTGPVGELLYGVDPTKCEVEADGEIRDRCRIEVEATHTGKTAALTLGGAARDIDALSAGKRLAITWSVGGEQGARISLVKLADLFASPRRDKLAPVVIKVPNCADELVIVPGENKALLSPAWCGTDPISLIDLHKAAFIKNLPGFGPIAVSEDGATAVGYTRKDAMADKWGTEQPTEIALIVISLANDSWKLHPWGAALPTFTIAPGGKHLYAFDRIDGHGDKAAGKFVQLELATLKERPIIGGAVTMDRFAWSGDGKHLFLLSNCALYQVANGLPVAHHVAVPGEPELLNLRPQQDKLILGEDDAPLFYIVDLHAADKVDKLHLSALSALDKGGEQTDTGGGAVQP